MAKQTKTKSQASYLSEQYRSSLGKLLDLSKDQEKKLGKKLLKEIDEWEDNTATLHSQLQKWNDLVENVVEETNIPFEGCSNIHIPIIAIYMKIYHSIFRRSILGSEMIWYSQSEDETVQEHLTEIDENLNYKAFNKWNIAEALNDVFWTTPRDKIGIIEMSYVEEYEKNVKDSVLVANEQEFLEEFPPEDKQMDDSLWEEYRNKVVNEANEENPVEIPIVYDKCIYKGPKAEVIELADFLIFPATAVRLDADVCRGYGKRFYMRRGEIKKKREDGLWYKEACNRILNKSKRGSAVSDYQSSKDYIDGLERGSNSDDYEFFSLVYRIELDKEEGEKKILVIFSKEHKEIVYCADYPYRCIDNYALFRIRKKPKRLLGGCIPEDLEDQNEEIDTLHNQRINSRKITEVPSFKAQKSSAKDFDPNAEQNQWRPGVIFWLDNPDAFNQFVVQPVDLGTSMQEEGNSMRITSLDMGVEPFSASGNVMQDDPNAPGNKTQMLMMASNMRMDDPISELKYGVEKVGEICLSMEYQFGPAQIEYYTKKDGKMNKGTLPKRLLRKPISIHMSAVGTVLNPQAEFMKWMTYYSVMIKDPMFAKYTKGRWNMWMEALKSGRVRNAEKYLPTLQEVEAEEQQMKQMMTQKAAEVMAQKQGEVAKQAGLQQIKTKAKADDLKLKVLENGIKKKEAIRKSMEVSNVNPETV